LLKGLLTIVIMPTGAAEVRAGPPAATPVHSHSKAFALERLDVAEAGPLAAFFPETARHGVGA
jgi:hypothetical protein